MYAIVYELSADGRMGRGIIYNSWDTGGGFREFAGAALAVAGFAFGAQFLGSLVSTVSTQMAAIQAIAIEEGLAVSSSALGNVIGETIVSQLTAEGVALNAANATAVQAINAFTTGAVAAIAGATALGTVDQQIASSGVEGQEGVWIWTWSQAPGFQETTDVVGDNDLCLNIEGIQTTVPDGYTRDPANGTCTRGVCPNGATNYPVCTIVNTCVDPEANNFGRALPCTYEPGRKCVDPAAINFNGALPCRYRPIICPANLSYCGTGANANKLCRRTYGSAPQCNFTESCAACSYGCADSACIPTPPSPEITGWQVAPLLLRSGESTFVSWNATDVSDCAVSGTNGDSWSGTTGTRKQSSAILGQTTFSISCSALSGASPATVSTTSKTVNIIPTFQER